MHRYPTRLRVREESNTLLMMLHTCPIGPHARAAKVIAIFTYICRHPNVIYVYPKLRGAIILGIRNCLQGMESARGCADAPLLHSYDVLKGLLSGAMEHVQAADRGETYINPFSAKPKRELPGVSERVHSLT